LYANKDVFGSARPADLYDVKKDLYDVLALFGINANSLITTKDDVPSYYNPVRSGAIKMGNQILGFFGEIHPLKTAKFNIKNKVNVFELYLDNLPKLQTKTTQKKKFILNDLQPIYRDFAFIVPQDLEVGKIIDVVKKIDKELIKDINLFDIYQGKNLENKKSIAFSVKIQPNDKTLTTEEIDVICNKIIKSVADGFDATLRDA
jgi:phenylalanyl-tRNA synthetase beta chain